MYLSRVQLNLARLSNELQLHWQAAPLYASHQWLWQLFPQQETRNFLFRHEQGRHPALFYLLSSQMPQAPHPYLVVESKPFSPRLVSGMRLQFALRANPVVVRQKKRCDVLMDAKFQAQRQGNSAAQIWQQQQQAAQRWLVQQGEKCGFSLDAEQDSRVLAYQQHSFSRRREEPAIRFSSVDYAGVLTLRDSERFLAAMQQGFGKSKALGCGLLLIKRC